MKSTWFKNKIHYEFAKCLQESANYLNFFDCFYSFIEMTGLAFQQSIRMFQDFEIDMEIEKKYLEIYKRFKYPNKMAEALGLLVIGLEENAHDFLGTVSGDMCLNDKSYKGQVFTPNALAQLCAQLTLPASPEGFHLSNRLTIDEPACGGGAMLIEAFKTLKDRGFSPRQFFITANDVDYKCVMMTYIQGFLLDIPLVVRHMNTLSLEQWKTYPTMQAIKWPLCAEAICLI